MMKQAKIHVILSGLLLFSVTGAGADEAGIGKDGPNAAPTNPDAATEESTSFWDTVLATFDFSNDE